jgi:E3 ubiquitin-protein ligase MARCH6
LQIEDTFFTAPDAIAATKDFIAPVAGGMVVMILLPPALVYGALRILPMQLIEHVPCKTYAVS